MRTITITFDVPEVGDGRMDAEDIKAAFRVPRAELVRLRAKALHEYQQAMQFSGPIVGVISSRDLFGFGSWSARAVWKAGLLRPLRGQDETSERGGSRVERGETQDGPEQSADESGPTETFRQAG